MDDSSPPSSSTSPPLSSHQKSEDIAARNRRTLWMVGIVILCMVGLTAASVPLYRLYCQVTGYGGKANRQEKPLDMKILDREIKVRFNSDVADNLNWSFKADQPPVSVKLGQEMMISFSAENMGDRAVAGTALFNVSPPQAGVYFHKTQCFCFDYQMIAPHKQVHFPVVFYIDPALDRDEQLKDLKSVTLSYVFYRAESPELDRALQDFYNQP